LGEEALCLLDRMPPVWQKDIGDSLLLEHQDYSSA
jgi:hypothetical protein